MPRVLWPLQVIRATDSYRCLAKGKAMWFPGARHTVESVAMQLVEGLENGSLFLREADRPVAGQTSPIPSSAEDADGERLLSVEELKEARERVEQRAGEAEERTRRLAELSRKARRGLATLEEIQELDRLEEMFSPPAI